MVFGCWTNTDRALWVATGCSCVALKYRVNTEALIASTITRRPLPMAAMGRVAPNRGRPAWVGKVVFVASASPGVAGVGVGGSDVGGGAVNGHAVDGSSGMTLATIR